MRLPMFQTHFHSTRPLTSAHLAQTMTLLSLTTDELRQQIDSELSSNPALEMIEERRCPMCHSLLPSKGPCPICSRQQSPNANEPIVLISSREDFYTGNGKSIEEMPDNDYSAASDDLPTYVFRQIAPELSLQDRPIAAFILTHLNDDGLLTTTAVEVARYHHVPLERIMAIIKLIQRSDPVGVGSSCPEEALMVQLDVLSETSQIPEHAKEAIDLGMDLLSRHQYAELARLLKISQNRVIEIARFISENLNPYPGRSHWGDSRQPAQPSSQVYHQPDIIIGYVNDRPENPLLVEIIMPLNGTLRINPLFRQALHQVSENKIEEWKSDLERASLLIKCLQQRNHTMRRLMQRVATIQKNFILNGEEELLPLTRAQLSKELDVHESTISRAVSGKSVQLPNSRIVPLSMFFDRSLNVRTILRNMIDREHHPLNDTQLVDLLAKQGIFVARRTVAKYRSMEGILPAHLRHSMIATL